MHHAQRCGLNHEKVLYTAKKKKKKKKKKKTTLRLLSYIYLIISIKNTYFASSVIKLLENALFIAGVLKPLNKNALT